MKHLDLFSGIGGFAYAARQVWGNEYKNVGFCEVDSFCQNVIRKNFPNTTIHPEIRTLTNPNSKRLQRDKTKKGRDHRSVDLITGGFPCQPFSVAGKRLGTTDNRYLWPEMLRVIREFQPTWIIAENVGGFVTWNNGLVLEQVCVDLEKTDYEVQSFIIPACAADAPHRRDRIWIVANISDQDSIIADTRRLRRAKGRSPTIQSKGQESEQPNSQRFGWQWDWQEVAFATCLPRVDDGFSRRMVRLPDGTSITEAKWRKEAIKAYGNAIVPQVAIEIMKAIKETMCTYQ